MTRILYKNLCYQIVGAIYETRNLYGPGQKEIVYQKALAEEFKEKNIPYKREVVINIISPKTGKKLGAHRADFVVDDKIILELKSMKFTPKKIEQQLYSYLRSTPYELGYLINMGSTNIFIKRVILTNDRKPYLHLSSIR
jgi:GxxExxY protein